MMPCDGGMSSWLSCMWSILFDIYRFVHAWFFQSQCAVCVTVVVLTQQLQVSPVPLLNTCAQYQAQLAVKLRT